MFNQGDIVWLNFTPQSGHEQGGKRPAVVVSNDDYNDAIPFTIVCPITSKDKNYPLHIALPEDMKIQGVIMLDQMKALDLKARNAQFSGERLPAAMLEDITEKLRNFL